MNDIRQFVTGPQTASVSRAKARPAKGYWIAHINIDDPVRYQLYNDINDDAFARYGGRYIVRGGDQHVLEGAVKSRTVIVEFENLQTALDCYYSVENQTAVALRKAVSRGDLVIVAGSDDD